MVSNLCTMEQGSYLFPAWELFEPHPEKTFLGVSDQVQQKRAVQQQKIATGLKFQIYRGLLGPDSREQ